MNGTRAAGVGFAQQQRGAPAPRRYLASLELIAGAALVLSTVVAATVVSIGIARADGPAAVAMADHSIAVAVMLGLILAGWAGLTALMTRDAPPRD